jgi:hypothetical protein
LGYNPINSVCEEEVKLESDEEMCESVEQIFLEKTEHKELETINVIHLQYTQANSEQHEDKDLVWIYNLLKREQFENNKQEVLVFENNKQESFYKQRHRLQIIHNKCIDR